MSKEEALETDDNVFNFQIVGKNTSNKDIYYGISLANDLELTGKTRIKPENINLVFRLISFCFALQYVIHYANSFIASLYLSSNSDTQIINLL